jgi:GGDEF domain-containing protein
VQQGSLPDPELVHPAGRRSPGVPPACDTTQGALLARLERLTEQLEQKSRLLREHEAQLARSRALFERASCDGEGRRLGMRPRLRRYAALDGCGLRSVRIAARLADRSGADGCDVFAGIARGNAGPARADRRVQRFHARRQNHDGSRKERWMRLTADVESENGVAVRIFGMKQDITAERALWDKTRYLAETDVMTGLANRSQFQTILSELDAKREACRRAAPARRSRRLQAGQRHLRPCARGRMPEAGRRAPAQRLCRETRLVARIGGDEFAVLMQGDAIVAAGRGPGGAHSRTLHLPVVWREHSFQLGASIGIALPPGLRGSRARPSSSAMPISRSMPPRRAASIRSGSSTTG